MASISHTTPCLASELKSAYRKHVRVGGRVAGTPTFATDLCNKFRLAYKDCEATAFEEFTSPDKVQVLAHPMLQLIAYHELASELKWTDAKKYALCEMEQIVGRQIAVMLEHESAFDHTEWIKTLSSQGQLS